jgi:hypothetical protein
LGGRGGAIVICGYFKNWWGKVAHFGDVAHVVIKYVSPNEREQNDNNNEKTSYCKQISKFAYLR